MTIAERYSRATRSSHLEVKPLEVGDIDIVMAAGMSDGLGVRLLRLRAEFDGVAVRAGAWSLRRALRSYRPTIERVVALIWERAGRTGSAITHDRMGGSIDGFGFDMAGSLIDHWLSPHCQPCTGRGVVGEYGKPQIVCNACGGSKRRLLFWPAADQDFADRIAAEMEAKVDQAERRIRRLLQQV